LILEDIERELCELGYRSTIWTAPLLSAYLEAQHDLRLS
jgi:hypothetical protein